MVCRQCGFLCAPKNENIMYGNARFYFIYNNGFIHTTRIIKVTLPLNDAWIWKPFRSRYTWSGAGWRTRHDLSCVAAIDTHLQTVLNKHHNSSKSSNEHISNQSSATYHLASLVAQADADGRLRRLVGQVDITWRAGMRFQWYKTLPTSSTHHTFWTKSKC